MPSRVLNAIYLLSGMLFVPVTLYVTHAITGEGPGGLLTTASILIIYYIPILAIFSAFRPHFTPRLAAAPLLAILALELWAFIPGYAPFALLGGALSPYWPNVNPAVLGKSAFVVIGAAISALSLIHKITIFRLTATVMAVAQCTVMVLFHVVVLTWPFEGMEKAERNMVTSAVEADHDMSRLCGLSGRICKRGTLAQVQDWARSDLRAPAQTVSLIEDTADRPRLFYTWIQPPTSGALDQVSIISALKHDVDDIEIMASREGPTTLYAELRVSIGILLALFHIAWIILGLAILARHGNYAFRKGRWRRDG